MSNEAGYCDFHCHLDDECFNTNRWQLIDHCFSSGLDCIFTVADPCTGASLVLTEEMTCRRQQIYAICGAHPHHADHYSAEIEKEILSFLKKKQSCGCW